MRNFERDLRFFEGELEKEEDPFKRNLLLGQIRDIKMEILQNLRRERAQVERENRNLQDALESCLKAKKS
jgi:phage shock protein A